MKIISTREAANAFGLKILVHGPAGAGKTRLCATTGDLKNTLIISAEGGLLSVMGWDIDVVQVRHIDDVYEVFNFLRKGDHHYKWVCLDSISEIAEVVLAGEKMRNRDARRAYGEMADTVFDLIRGFRNLNCHVLMTAKQGREEIDGRTLHAPMLPGRLLTLNVAYLFDEVFALRVETNSEGEVIRVLQTGKSKSFDAKDRSGALNMFEEANLATIAQKIQRVQLDAVGADAEEDGEPSEADDTTQEAEADAETTGVTEAEVVQPQPVSADPAGSNGADISPTKGTQPAPKPKVKKQRKAPEPKKRVATPEATDAKRVAINESAIRRTPGAEDELRRAHLRRRLFMLLKEARLNNDQIASYMLARCEQEFGVKSIQDVPVDALELWAKALEVSAKQEPGRSYSPRTRHVIQIIKRYDDWKEARQTA